MTDGVSRAHGFHGDGAGTAVQLLGLLGAQGGDLCQGRPGTVHASQSHVVGQDQPETAAGQEVHGRSGAAEGVECSGPAVVDGRPRQPDQKRVGGTGAPQSGADDLSQTISTALKRLLGCLVGVGGKRQEAGGVEEPRPALLGTPASEVQ